MNQALVSVIVPVFNTEPYLPRLLDSILSQSLTQIEVICVDNGSTDQSVKIVETYATRDRRVILETETRRGSAAARNKGIDAATGRYCIFFDSDDYCPNSNALAALTREAENNEAAVVRGNHLQLTEETGATSRQDFFGVELFVDKRKAVDWLEEPVLWIPWTHQVFLIRRQFLLDRQIRYPDYLRGQDPPFLLQVFLAAGRLHCIPDLVYIYRNSNERWANFVWSEQACEHYLRHFSDIRRLLLKQSLKQQWRVYATWGVRKLSELLPVAMTAGDGASRRLILEAFSDFWDYRDIDPSPYQADVNWDLLFFSLYQCHRIEAHDGPCPEGVPFLGAEACLEQRRVSRLVPAGRSIVPRLRPCPALGDLSRSEGTDRIRARVKLRISDTLKALGLFPMVSSFFRRRKRTG